VTRLSGKYLSVCLGSFASIGLHVGAPALAAKSDATTAEAAENQEPEYQAGYGELTTFGGPEGVAEQLRKADVADESIYQWESARRIFKPWYDWKGRVQYNNGLALGFFVSLLGQQAGDSTTNDDNALGGIYRFQGSWTLVNRGRKDPGRIEWRIENRSNIGGFQAPNTLGGAVGAAALNTGFGYAEKFKTDLSVLNWTQGFFDERVGIAVGRLAFDVYLDAMPFQTFSRGFLNRSFVVNPTMGITGIGALGAVVKGFVGRNFLIGAQVYDGNAASGEYDWDTFQENEYLKAIEFGWTPSYARRKNDKIQFTYWDKDAREKAGGSGGHGWAVSGSWQFGDRLLSFVRFGDSNGGGGVPADSALNGGFEYAISRTQKWSLGAGWAQPVRRNDGTRPDDELVIETSYVFQLARNFSLMPDLQLLIDPANNPGESEVWVFSLRAILTL